ncbi:MAG TPA: P-loop NTPase [Candidatus Azoamicus sp. OHIO1]
MSIVNIKNIIGVVSSKGGVGKTTMAVNIAMVLSNFYGMKVGLLDADICGPNHPKIFGFKSVDKDVDSNLLRFDKDLNPKIYKNILSMSFGYYLQDSSPVLFRGPVISNIFLHLLNNTNWGNIDFLIIDFPPGTGDVYISMIKSLKLNGVFLVTIPQVLSIQDNSRMASMLKKFNISIISIIENMKFYKCFKCGSLEKFYSDENLIMDFMLKFNIVNHYEFPYSVDVAQFCNSMISSDIISIYRSLVEETLLCCI